MKMTPNMRLVGYNILTDTFYGEDRKEYTREQLNKLFGIWNPADHMVPLGHAKPARDVKQPHCRQMLTP